MPKALQVSDNNAPAKRAKKAATAAEAGPLADLPVAAPLPQPASGPELAALQTQYAQVVAAAQQVEAEARGAEAPLRAKCTALEGLISALRADNAALQARLESEGPVPVAAVKSSKLFLATSSENAALTKQVAALQGEVATLRAAAVAPSATASRLLPFFSALTALTVTPPPGRPSGLACGMYGVTTAEAGSGTPVAFGLDVFEDEEGEGALSVEFVPGAGCAASLPSFLHDRIQFGLDQLPMLLAKVTEALRHMKYDGASGEENGVPVEAAVGEAAASAPVASPAAAALDSGSPTVMLQPSSARKAAVEGGSEMEVDQLQAGTATPGEASTAASARTPAGASAAVAALRSPSLGAPRRTPVAPAVPEHAAEEGAAASSTGMAEGTAAAAEAAAAVASAMGKIGGRRTTRATTVKAGKGAAPGSAPRGKRQSMGAAVGPEGLLFVASPA